MQKSLFPDTIYVSNEEQQAIALLIDANGLMSPRAPSKVTSIELFMAPFNGILGLRLFPNLLTLELISCGIQELQGLDSLTSLTRLSLCENRISRIENLEALRSLKTLDLRGNLITFIENLNCQTALSSLTLSENRISTIGNMGRLLHLQYLNLADNQIDEIPDELLLCQQLTDINLSGNRIGSLDDVRRLGDLSNLRQITFSDPHYGDNPIVSLCNYRTFATYHLAQVDVIDLVEVSGQARSLAQGMYMKKIMYYNMRIKMTKKDGNNVIRAADRIRLQVVNILDRSMAQVWGQIRHLQLMNRLIDPDMATTTFTGSNIIDVMANVPDGAIREKSQVLKTAEHDLRKERALIDDDFEQFKLRIQGDTNLYIGRLMMELNTGGNIRLEDGAGGNDAWVAPTLEQIESQIGIDLFCDGFDVVSVEILSITRVHNRFLRMCFEKGHENVAIEADMGLYFIGLPTGDFVATQNILNDFVKYGVITDGVRLYQKLAIADRDRLRVMVDTDPLYHQRRVTKRLSTMIVKASSGHIDDVPRQLGDILPEFIIEYRYQLSTSSDNSSSVSFDDMVLPPTDSDPISTGNGPHKNRQLAIALRLFEARWCGLDQSQCESGLAMSPRPAAIRHKFVAIPTDNVGDTVEWIDICGHDIVDISHNLNRLVCLHTLILTFNRIETMTGISELHQLRYLDLGYNRVERIEGLAGLAQLTTCYLNNNRLGRVEDLEQFHLHCPRLNHLNVTNNPICSLASYRTAFQAAFVPRADCDPDRFDSPSTQYLFAHDVLDHSLISKGAIFQKGSDYDAEYDSVIGLILDHQQLKSISLLNEAKFPKLKTASFCDNRLDTIEGFDGCPDLEGLSLEDNFITRITNLSGLPRLTRLELGSNRISVIQGMDDLHSLQQLSLEDNLITEISGLEQCPQLLELYLSNNQIDDLKRTVRGLCRLPNLVILDLAGNPICQQDSYRLYCIFNIKKLKVLDGINITAAEIEQCKMEFEGRVTEEFLEEWMAYNGETGEHSQGPRSECLDLSSSQIRFLDRIDPTRFTYIRQVNLEHNSLTQVESLSCLPSLTSLNLNHNHIVDIADGAWSTLIALEQLHLTNNRISSIIALHLHHLPRLKLLNLQSNLITVFNGLSASHHLRHLNLNHNHVSSFDGATNLTSLRCLSLDSNALRSIGPICVAERFPRLQSLSCAANRIAPITDLDLLSSLPFLSEITLSGNPLARHHLYRPTLIRSATVLRIADGHDVTASERARMHALFAIDEAGGRHAPLPPTTVAPPEPGHPQLFRNVLAVKGLSGKRPMGGGSGHGGLVRSPRTSTLVSRPGRRKSFPNAVSLRGSQIRMLLQQVSFGRPHP